MIDEQEALSWRMHTRDATLAGAHSRRATRTRSDAIGRLRSTLLSRLSPSPIVFVVDEESGAVRDLVFRVL
jgi:hypothetical protein